MIKIAVLLNGGIAGDSRVIKTIKTFSNTGSNLVDLYYINPTNKDSQLFNKKVRLFPYNYIETFKQKFIKHTFFYNEYMFFVREVLNNRERYDYIYANDLPCLRPAIKLKKKIGSKVIYDSHEIYIETINQFFPKTKGVKKIVFYFLIWFMRFVGLMMEKKLLKKVDSFVTVGESLKNYFNKKYNVKNINVVLNVPFKSNNILPVNLHEKLGLDPTDFLVIYQGMLNLGRGLYFMIETLKYTNPNVKLIVLGYGTLKKSLAEFTKINNLNDRVLFHDKVDADILLNYTAGANCGICLLEPLNLSCENAAPNKLFEYINAGIPVIASNTPECKRLLSVYSVGVLVNNNPIEIADAINNLSKNDLTIYKENCALAAKKYNWENQELVLLNLIDD